MYVTIYTHNGDLYHVQTTNHISTYNKCGLRDLLRVNGTYSGSTQANRFIIQNTHCRHWTSFINLLHLLRSTTSSLFVCRFLKFLSITSIHVILASGFNVIHFKHFLWTTRRLSVSISCTHTKHSFSLSFYLHPRHGL